MIHDIEAEVHQEIIKTKIIFHKTDTVLPLEIVLVMTNTLLLDNALVRGITIIKETHDLIALLIDPPTNHRIDVTLVTDIDHAHILEITILHNTKLPSDHLRDQEILGFSKSRSHSNTRNKLIQSNHKPETVHLTLKYKCFTQPRWQTL